MTTKQERTLVMKYACHVVREVTYYTPDRRKVTALGPVGDADLEPLEFRPARNTLAGVKRMRIGSNGTPGTGVPMFWAIPVSLFAALTLFGPFSVFGGGGFLVGVAAGMANTGISAGVGAGLYLLEAWAARREAAGWAQYDTLLAEGRTAALISDDDVSTVADLIDEIETGIDRLSRCGLSADEYGAQMVPLVEEAMLYASDCYRSYRESLDARRMLAGISNDDVENDDELRQLQDDWKAIEAATSTAFAQWMSTRWKLDVLGREIHDEADLAEAKLVATLWNAQRRTGGGA